jgi:hypothetical protein
MKKIFFSVLLTTITTVLLAGGNPKTTAINGIVTDKQGEPLIGAKVMLEGLGKSVYTDFEGHFTLSEVPKQEQKISVSHISYEDQKSS